MSRLPMTPPPPPAPPPPRPYPRHSGHFPFRRSVPLSDWSKWPPLSEMTNQRAERCSAGAGVPLLPARAAPSARPERRRRHRDWDRIGAGSRTGTMFRRKLSALDYHNPAGFNCRGEGLRGGRDGLGLALRSRPTKPFQNSITKAHPEPKHPSWALRER